MLTTTLIWTALVAGVFALNRESTTSRRPKHKLSRAASTTKAKVNRHYRAKDRILSVRGGSFDVEAREAGQLVGIDKPATEVVRVIVKATKLTKDTLLKKKLRSKRGLYARGGAFDVDSRETGEFVGIEKPATEVVRVIVKATKLTKDTLLKKKLRSKRGLYARGGALDADARETGEFVGIEKPATEVVRVIVKATKLTKDTLLKKKLRSKRGLYARGGSFDVDSRETGELVGIEKPATEVVRVIVKATKLTKDTLLKKKLRSKRGLYARGGALDASARQTGEAAGVDEPSLWVARLVRRSFKSVGRAVLKVFSSSSSSKSSKTSKR